MLLSDFDYPLPEDLIAQRPLEDRAASRMLVLRRREGRWEDRMFRDFPQFLRPGDCLVLNDTKVFPSRLFGRRSGVHSLPVGKHNPKRFEHLSGRVEVFLLRPLDQAQETWEALVHPGRKMRVGERIYIEGSLEAEIVDRGEYGRRTIRLKWEGDLSEALQRAGHVPLPPYIRRSDEPADRERYQTVFAREPGSAAAPTAGLHFTPQILEQCRTAGADIAFVTLHVGLGTFRPIREKLIEEHRLHSEQFHVSRENVHRIRSASRRVVVGTTSVRVVETVLRTGEWSGETELFIYPGFDFQGTDAMLTNFHLPRSSLLILVCAFAGTDLTLAAYRHALDEKYRLYSYGDCMLIV